MMQFLAVELSQSGVELKQSQFCRPDSGLDYIVVKINAAGVCHSDIREIRSIRALRHDFGHEFIGTVVEASKSIMGLLGQRVTFNPNIGVQKTSGFAEFVLASGDPSKLLEAFTAVDTSLPDELAILVEPLACAVHCVSSLSIHLASTLLATEKILIQGAGTFALLIAAVLRKQGFGVRIRNRGNKRIAFGLHKGLISPNEIAKDGDKSLKIAIIATSESQPAIVTDLLECYPGLDSILLFGGTRPTGEFALEKIDFDVIRRTEGREPVSIGGRKVWLLGSYGATSLDFRTAIQYLNDGIPVESLLNGKINLQDLPARLLAFASGEPYQGRLLVLPNSG
jgi:threonine dehydrogenase-like Zn-dependent dehydrogenase